MWRLLYHVVCASALTAPAGLRSRVTRLRSAPPNGGDDAAALWAEAARLRREIEAEEALLPQSEREQLPEKSKDVGLSVVLPIANPDWTVEEKECFFAPRNPSTEAKLLAFDVPVPCGLILAERDDETGTPCVVVAEVGRASNAEKAGLLEGDILRATTAVRQQMEMPTWQLLGGGIGRPRLFRFVFGADLDAKPQRTFEEVLGAVASNRLDERPAILVVERKGAQ